MAGIEKGGNDCGIVGLLYLDSKLGRKHVLSEKGRLNYTIVPNFHVFNKFMGFSFFVDWVLLFQKYI